MELPDEYTSFWSAQIVPGTVCKITVPEDVECVLSNAALSQEPSRPEVGKSRLFAKVNGQMETVIVAFTINSFESTMLDIQFGEKDVIEFTVQGECPVHIAGYITGGFALDIENPVGGPVLSAVAPLSELHNEVEQSLSNEVSPNEEAAAQQNEGNGGCETENKEETEPQQQGNEQQEQKEQVNEE